MTLFLLIRHAETDAVGKSISGWLPQVPLNSVGVLQARRLAERLKSVRLDAIYSSPLERAIATAEELARPRGLPVLRSEAVGEVHMGSWSGLSFAELDPQPAWQRFNSVRSMARAPGGELMLETQARMISELECLRQRHHNQQIAVVSHADVIKAAVTLCAGMPLDFFHRIEISPASVSVLSLDEYSPRILRLNDTGEFV